MNCIVHGAIHEVSQNKAWKKHEGIRTHQQPGKSKYSGSNDQAWYRRHKKALPVSGIVVMVAMKRVNKSLRTTTVGNHMKKESMRNIFKEAPKKHPPKEDKNNLQRRETEPGTAVIKHINNYRNIHSPNNQGMGFGEHFQEIILE